MFVTMKPTRGNSSPLCHSTFATTRRARSQLSARYQKSSYRITGRFGGLPTGRISKGAISYCSTLLLGSRLHHRRTPPGPRPLWRSRSPPRGAWLWGQGPSCPRRSECGGKVRSGLHRHAQSGLPMVRARRDPPSRGRWTLDTSPGPQAIPRAVRCRRGGHHSAAIGEGRTAQTGGRGLGSPAVARGQGRAPHRGPPGAPASAGK